jgi:hypothetical protein
MMVVERKEGCVAITYLQSAAHLLNAMDQLTPILPKDIQEIAGIVPNTIVCKFAQTLGIDIQYPSIKAEMTMWRWVMSHLKPQPLPSAVLTSSEKWSSCLFEKVTLHHKY